LKGQANMEQSITESVLLLFLALAGWLDRKRMMLPVILPAAGALTGILINLLTKQLSILEIAAGTGIGLMMLLVGYASRQALGYGDGLLMAAAGCFLGSMQTSILLLCSLLAAAVVSIILILAKKRGWKDRIPFAPCVLAGFVFMKGIFG